jgi:hypothetical protein
VIEVPASRPKRHLATVDEQFVTVVGRDVDHEGCGFSREIKGPPEVIDTKREGLRPGYGDPLRAPALVDVRALAHEYNQ